MGRWFGFLLAAAAFNQLALPTAADDFKIAAGAMLRFACSELVVESLDP